MTTVSNASELLSALATASEGDVITLAAGDYGDVTLSGYYFAADVILISAEPLAASFTSLTIESSSHLVLDGIAVNHILQQGEPDWTAGFRIEDADHITIRNAEISGSADGVATNDGEGLVILELEHDPRRGDTVPRPEVRRLDQSLRRHHRQGQHVHRDPKRWSADCQR